MCSIHLVILLLVPLPPGKPSIFFSGSIFSSNKLIALSLFWKDSDYRCGSVSSLCRADPGISIGTKLISNSNVKLSYGNGDSSSADCLRPLGYICASVDLQNFDLGETGSFNVTVLSRNTYGSTPSDILSVNNDMFVTGNKNLSAFNNINNILIIAVSHFVI
jgi:hypothetical protein